MLIAAEILAEQKTRPFGIGRRRHIVDRLGEKGQLLAVAARIADLVNLPGLAETRGDENALGGR